MRPPPSHRMTRMEQVTTELRSMTTANTQEVGSPSFKYLFLCETYTSEEGVTEQGRISAPNLKLYHRAPLSSTLLWWLVPSRQQ